jgi:hypothetical protein
MTDLIQSRAVVDFLSVAEETTTVLVLKKVGSNHVVFEHWPSIETKTVEFYEKLDAVLGGVGEILLIQDDLICYKKKEEKSGPMNGCALTVGLAMNLTAVDVMAFSGASDYKPLPEFFGTIVYVFTQPEHKSVALRKASKWALAYNEEYVTVFPPAPRKTKMELSDRTRLFKKAIDNLAANKQKVK